MPRSRSAFTALWTAVTVSGLGDGLRFTAIPLLAASLSDRADVVALVTAAGTLPGFLLGLPAGVLADRVERRRILWVTELMRTFVAAGFVVLLYLGVRNVALLVALALLIAAGQTLFSTALVPFVAVIVPREGLTRANSKLTGAQLLTIQFAGPALAGFLFAADQRLPFLIDAATFLVSALLLTTMAVPRSVAPTGGGARVRLADGLHAIREHTALRAQAVMEFAFSLITGMVLGVLVLHVRDTLHLSSGGYGLVVALGAVGGLLGTTVVGRLRDRYGDGPPLTAAVAGTAGGLAVLGLLPHLAATAVAMLVIGGTGVFWSIVTVTLRQESVPGELLGRVTSTYRMIRTGSVPLGALVAGLVAQGIGVSAVFVCGALTVAVAGLACRGGFAAPLDMRAADPTRI